MPCNSTTFANKISYADIPNFSTKDEVQLKHWNMLPMSKSPIHPRDYPKKNLVKLDIYCEDLNIYRTIKRPVIELSALISDIGGQLGLFLGFSALTFMELFELFMFKLNRCFTSMRQPRERAYAEEEVEGNIESDHSDN